MPVPRLGNEFFEDMARHFVFFEGSLGMPLHAENPVLAGSAFDGFDDSILGERATTRRASPGMATAW